MEGSRLSPEKKNRLLLPICACGGTTFLSEYGIRPDRSIYAKAHCARCRNAPPTFLIGKPKRTESICPCCGKWSDVKQRLVRHLERATRWQHMVLCEECIWLFLDCFHMMPDDCISDSNLEFVDRLDRNPFWNERNG